MVKKLSILFGILFMGLAVSAQINMRDVVHLKNGGITKGIIIEQIPNESIKVQTADGSIFVYKMDEIEKIEKEKVTTPETKVATNQNSMPVQNNNYIYMPPRKSTFGAGFLSFLIPGAGELYATDWEQGWGSMLICYVGIPAITGLVSLIMGEFNIGGLIAMGALEVAMWVGSISRAVKLAKEVNLKNGYLSFQIGDKAHLGVRPEFSYNNMMMPSGSMSPQFTTGLGLSLSF
ncbi:MAG: hypothetical protein UHM19_06790 [Bacteroidales bacterium]|nr:hypothetical protein [Bacteroidales bacterium]